MERKLQEDGTICRIRSSMICILPSIKALFQW